ncbi:MAG: restriction endonuclease, partial [Candidatus Parabeggiatoa sp. nov. 1]
MDLIDELKALSSKVSKQLDIIQTEEATKNAFVMPFINALGYNVFDPSEVTPELTADVGTKKGEKVDYAILKEGKPIMLFECKWCGIDLDKEHKSQLYRYFSVTDARIGVLTNGVIYRFYTDLEEPNKMDARPFLEFNLLNIKESIVEELKMFSKSVFSLDETLTAATELKHTTEIKRIFAEQLTKPSENFVKFFASQVYSGKLTQAVKQEFTEFTKKALNHFINDRINERLKSALTTVDEENTSSVSPPIQPPYENQTATKEVKSKEEAKKDRESRVVTTEAEIEGHLIVRK